jgi:hypothetical protein
MWIELKNGKRADIKDVLAKVLIDRGLAVEVRDEVPESKPKRQYRRRDMTAEAK